MFRIPKESIIKNFDNTLVGRIFVACGSLSLRESDNFLTSYVTAEIKYISKQIDKKLIPPVDSLIVNSSTEGSVKRFRLTVDDTGTITATEVT